MAEEDLAAKIRDLEQAISGLQDQTRTLRSIMSRPQWMTSADVEYVVVCLEVLHQNAKALSDDYARLIAVAERIGSSNTATDDAPVKSRRNSSPKRPNFS